MLCNALGSVLGKREEKQIMKEMEKQSGVMSEGLSLFEYLSKVILTRPRKETTAELHALLLSLT